MIDNLGLPEEDRRKVNKIIDALKSHMKGAINETVERRNFRKRQQFARESFDNFLVALRDLVTTCNYCTDACTDNALRDQIIEGLLDGDTVEELLRQKDLTLSKTIQVCRAHEAAKQQRLEITGNSPEIGVTSAYKAKRQQRQPPKQNPLQRNTLRNCGRCGKPRHKELNQCPALNRSCNKCHKVGHFAMQCRTTSAHINQLPGDQPDEQSETKDNHLFSVHAMQGLGKAPKVSVLVQGRNGSAQLKILPDSGADISAADETILIKLGEHIDNLLPSRENHAYSVDGSALKSIGLLHVTITLGDVSIDDTLHIFPKIPGGMLISWRSAQQLKILPKDYPAQIQAMTAKTCSVEVTADDLVHEFPTVFDGQVKTMKGERFKIHLKEEAKPFCVTAPRTIPYAYRDKVQQELHTLESQGIIQPVTEPTEWCAPIVVAPKRDCDNVRICIDFSKLNKFVKREFYSSGTPMDAIADISDEHSKFFTVFDALKGYHQCPLDEQSQVLTTFMTPFGRYKFLRAPYGICSISEHYNRRMDEAFTGLCNYRRIVDDVIIFDRDRSTHLAHVRQFLQRCADKGISLNKEKFKFAQTSTTFAGYQLSEDGYKVDHRLMAAIRDFPLPGNVTDLRSFFGLANQLAGSTDKIAQYLHPLRPLLKSNNDFLWGPDHTKAFDLAKIALSDVATLKFFDPAKTTRLMTDASNTGLGFVLQQKHRDTWQVIQAGSRFLSDPESRYATIEKEMLGVAWAVKKCHKFLAGLAHFEVITDHNPLLPILNNRRLDEIENPRLQRLRTKLMGYNFTAFWQKGVLHAAPDALSRHPIFDPVSADEIAEYPGPYPCQIAAVQQRNELNLKLQEVLEAAQVDPEYQQLKSLIFSGFPHSKNILPDRMKPFWRVRHDLTLDDDFVLFGCRLFIPNVLRERVLYHLHESHQGITRTKERARLAVYWPGIDGDIEKIIAACKECQDELPSLPKEPMIQRAQPDRPFQHLAVDFAQYNGLNYLIMVDSYTDWPSIQVMHRDITAKSLISALRDYFARTAIPDVVFSDGGPQFTSQKFANFLLDWGVMHLMSSPGYPQSNGKAEATVKAMKKLIRRCTNHSGLDENLLARSLLQYRNTPNRKDRLSPAQKLYGHPIQDTLPVHRRAFDPKWQLKFNDFESRKTESLRKTQTHYNQHATPLPEISVGTRVAVQNRESKLFDIYGTVIFIDNKFRKYSIKTDNGGMLIRNRKFIRKRVPRSLLMFDPDLRPKHVYNADSSSGSSISRRPHRNVNPPRRLIEDENWP